jgi:hypothetical protein
MIAWAAVSFVSLALVAALTAVARLIGWTPLPDSARGALGLAGYEVKGEAWSLLPRNRRNGRFRAIAAG